MPRFRAWILLASALLAVQKGQAFSPPTVVTSSNSHRTTRRSQTTFLRSIQPDMEPMEDEQSKLSAPSEARDVGNNKSKSNNNKNNEIMMIKGYDPSEGLPEAVNVGDPQRKVMEKEQSVTSILRELVAIQQRGPQKYCILGTRHCSYMHQQIIELL
jgi:hypothetical protein